jgi:hypothetical protein
MRAVVCFYSHQELMKAVLVEDFKEACVLRSLDGDTCSLKAYVNTDCALVVTGNADNRITFKVFSLDDNYQCIAEGLSN